MVKAAVVQIHNGVSLSHTKECVWVGSNEVDDLEPTPKLPLPAVPFGNRNFVFYVCESIPALWIKWSLSFL